MKKILVLAFLASLTVSPLWADEIVAKTTEELPVTPSDQLGTNQKWIERVEGTLSVPSSSDTSSTLNLGLGGGLAFGYRLNEHFSVSIASGYYQYGLKNIPFGNTGGNFSYVPLEGVFTYNFGEGTSRPYVSFGIGAAFNTYSLASGGLQANSYETSFFMSPAIGFLQVISPRAAIFIEGRIDMDYRSYGSQTGLGNGTPSVFIPIQAGLTFFVI